MKLKQVKSLGPPRARVPRAKAPRSPQQASAAQQSAPQQQAPQDQPEQQPEEQAQEAQAAANDQDAVKQSFALTDAVLKAKAGEAPMPDPEPPVAPPAPTPAPTPEVSKSPPITLAPKKKNFAGYVIGGIVLGVGALAFFVRRGHG